MNRKTRRDFGGWLPLWFRKRYPDVIEIRASDIYDYCDAIPGRHRTEAYSRDIEGRFFLDLLLHGAQVKGDGGGRLSRFSVNWAVGRRRIQEADGIPYLDIGKLQRDGLTAKQISQAVRTWIEEELRPTLRPGEWTMLKEGRGAAGPLARYNLSKHRAIAAAPDWLAEYVW